MCVNIASLLGFQPETPKAPKLPPIQKELPKPPKQRPTPEALTPKDEKPKVDFAKKMSVKQAKRIGADSLKVPLQQQASGGSTGGLNVP